MLQIDSNLNPINLRVERIKLKLNRFKHGIRNEAVAREFISEVSSQQWNCPEPSWMSNTQLEAIKTRVVLIIVSLLKVNSLSPRPRTSRPRGTAPS